MTHRFFQHIVSFNTSFFQILGAVVAREYGLPCIVGLTNATELFQTGDYVLMDGKKGTLEILEDDYV